MKAEYVCDICGKQLKNASGLAGHRMLSHPITRNRDNRNQPEEALAEISDDVERSIERLEQRLEDSESHVQELQEQLQTANGRLDDLRESMFERLQEETEARAKAESAAQTAQQELAKWQEGQLHHQLRSLWNHAENCEDCARDKAAIVAELAAQSRPKALEAAQEADGSASESASRVKRFRVVGETFLASWFFENYQPLPDGIEEPRVGDETEDEILAGHWRRAGYNVEERATPVMMHLLSLSCSDRVG